MLESRGYTVLSLPYFHWMLLETQGQREQYISNLLASVALASAPNIVAPSASLPSIAGNFGSSRSTDAELAAPVSDSQMQLPSIYGTEPFK